MPMNVPIVQMLLNILFTFIKLQVQPRSLLRSRVQPRRPKAALLGWALLGKDKRLSLTVLLQSYLQGEAQWTKWGQS